jgi:hypothetical protein
LKVRYCGAESLTGIVSPDFGFSIMVYMINTVFPVFLIIFVRGTYFYENS